MLEFILKELLEKTMLNDKILVVAAHPDDEVLGCGGSVAKWCKEGKEVNTIIMSEGATSRDNIRNYDNRKNELNSLISSAKEAANILGVKSVDFFNFPDNRMDSIDLLDIIKKIEEKIYSYKPNTIVTHHVGDLNIDHKITHQAVITAARTQLHNTVKCILTFETPSATEWQFSASNYFNPNWFEDTSKTLDIKIKALKKYKSEMRNWPHPRSYLGVESLAKWRGACVGFDSAEAFMLIRNIN